MNNYLRKKLKSFSGNRSILKIKQKPYNLFFISGAILILVSIFQLNQNNTFDFHFLDTYLIISNTFLFSFMAILFFIMWGLYSFLNRSLYSTNLVWWHVLVTIITVALIAIAIFISENNLAFHRLHIQKFSAWNYWEIMMKMMAALILILAAGQLIFFANLLWGLCKRYL